MILHIKSAAYLRHPCYLRAITRTIVIAISTLITTYILFLTKNIKYSANILFNFIISIKVLLAIISLLIIFLLFFIFSGIILSIVITLLLFKLFKLNNIIFYISLILYIFLIFIFSRKFNIKDFFLYNIIYKKIKIYMLFASLTSAGLVSWYLSINYIDSIIIYISAIISSTHIEPRPRIIINLFLGMIAGLPIIGNILSIFYSNKPINLSCSGDITLGRIIGIVDDVPYSRLLYPELDLSCADGNVSLTVDEAWRVLIIGNLSYYIFKKYIKIVFDRKEFTLESLEEELSLASSIIADGGNPTIRIGILTDASIVEGSLSIIGNFVSKYNIPIIIDYCNIFDFNYIKILIKALEGARSPLILQVCSLPAAWIEHYFTGPRSMRIACSLVDPKTSLWVATEIFGIPNPESQQINTINYLLKRKYCMSSNICMKPGVFTPTSQDPREQELITE